MRRFISQIKFSKSIKCSFPRIKYTCEKGSVSADEREREREGESERMERLSKKEGRK